MPFLSKVTLNASTENIKQQSTMFFKELTAIFSDIHGKSRKEIHDGNFSERMASCVEHHLGIRPAIEIGNRSNANDDYGPASLTVPPTFSHYAMSKKEASEYTEEIVGLRFNTQTGKISGNVKRVVCRLYFVLELSIRKLLTPEELAAITLHEIGHLYYMLYYAHTLSTTNIALEMIAKDFDGARSPKERVVLFKKYTGSVYHYLVPQIEETEDLKVLISLVYANIQQVMANELGSPEYGYTMDEYLADMYAVRHGAGLPMATGLDKLNELGGCKNVSELFLRTAETITLVTILLLAAAAAFIHVSISLFILIKLYSAMSNTAPELREYSYDMTVDRYKRIRNQVQLRMRLSSTTKAEHAVFKKELEALDSLIAASNNADSGFKSWYAIMTTKNVRNRNRQAELEMFFEDVAYNRLHEKALDLKFA